MQHLQIEGEYVDAGEGDGSIIVRRQVRAAVQETTRELRAALVCGYLGHLKELTISGVYLDRQNAGALATDLLAILRKGSLKTLELLNLTIFQQEDDDDDDDGGGGNASFFSRAAFAVDLLEGMAAHLPLLRDFQIDFPCDSNAGGVDLSDTFLNQRWPSLTILRSPFVTRRDAAVAAAAAAAAGGVGGAAGGAGGAPPTTFATAWAKGHFPRATTLVVSEWAHNPATRRSNLVRDLPTDGLAQITQLVLMGRALKNPLLNFIIAGQLTPQEAEFGGGGVITKPLFRNLQVLDISRLFLPAAYPEFVISAHGYAGAFYDLYQNCFTFNTTRAVQNISEAVVAPSTLILSDAFFGSQDWATPANVLPAGAMCDCVVALRPTKLFVEKMTVGGEGCDYSGQRLPNEFLDVQASLPYGPWATGDIGYTGTVKNDEDEDWDCTNPMSTITRNTCSNLHRLLSAIGPTLLLSELHIDGAFVHSYRSLLCSLKDTWLENGMFDMLGVEEDEGRQAIQFLSGVLEPRDQERAWGEWFFQVYEEHFTVGKILQASEHACAAFCKLVLGSGADTLATVPVFDFHAALLPLKLLRRLVIDNSRRDDADRELLCSLPPPCCEALVVREARLPMAEDERDSRAEWEAILQRHRQPKMPDYFPRYFKWKETTLTLSVEVLGVGGFIRGDLRSLWA